MKLPVTLAFLLICTAVAFADIKPKPRAEWGAKDKLNAIEGQYKKMGTVKNLSIHHTQSFKSKAGETEEQLLRNVQEGHLYHKDKNRPWPILKGPDGKPKPRLGDIAYHYIVGASGTIYEGRDPSAAPGSFTHYYSDKELEGVTYRADGSANPKGLPGNDRPGATEGHLTVSFLCGKPSDEIFDAKVMEKAAKFIAQLLHENSLEPKNIRVHRELANTKCPGEKLYEWVRGSNKQPGSLEGVGGALIVKYYEEYTKAE